MRLAMDFGGIASPGEQVKVAELLILAVVQFCLEFSLATGKVLLEEKVRGILVQDQFEKRLKRNPLWLMIGGLWAIDAFLKSCRCVNLGFQILAAIRHLSSSHPALHVICG
jgi:hypothetical protein